GPPLAHPRRGRQSAGEVGPGCFLDAVRRRGALQPAERPRLRCSQHQVFVLTVDCRSAVPRNEFLGAAMLKKTLGLALLAGGLQGGLPGAAGAAVSAQDAARLGNDLTPLGGEKAGNTDGSIPAWTGGIKSAAEAGFPNYKTGQNHPDPFAGDK